MLEKLKALWETVWLRTIIKTLVEKVPVLSKVLSYVDGHKTDIGRILMFVSALLAILQQFFPEIPYLSEIVTYSGAVIGWIMTELGLQHAAVKKLEGKE